MPIRLLALLLVGLLSLKAMAQDCPPPLQVPTQAELTRLERDARDRGFLWRIDKGGVTSYLYGTLHVQKRDWLGTGPRLSQALQSARALALELDLSDPEALRQLSAPPADIPRFTLPEALRQRLRARRRSECVDAGAEQALQAQAPQMQLAALELLAARRDGLEAAFGSEMTLTAAARAQGKPVHGLETVAEQLRALQPATEAESAQLIAQGLDELDSGAGRRVMARLAAAWSAGDADTLGHYEDWCDCLQTAAARAQMKRLLDDRNPLLAGRIDALHARRGPLLIGVGALHMFGPAGLPRLLEGLGFRVTRVF